MLGTAILVAIVGDPAGLAEALTASDSAYLFAAIASLVAGAVVLGLHPAVPAPAPLVREGRAVEEGDGPLVKLPG